MISKEELMQLLIKGRYECYIMKSSDYNPYKKSILYDWDFKVQIGNFVYTDSYRGFNPYSGVEYIYKVGEDIPLWFCDYIGYVNENMGVATEMVYGFLKEARGSHLVNCNGNLFSDYQYENEVLRYETYFQGDINSLLQKEKFFYGDNLIAQQITAGRLKKYD